MDLVYEKYLAPERYCVSHNLLMDLLIVILILKEITGIFRIFIEFLNIIIVIHYEN